MGTDIRTRKKMVTAHTNPVILIRPHLPSALNPAPIVI